MDDDARALVDERRRLLHELEVERNQLIRNIETCRIRDIDRPFIGDWSLRDIVGHVRAVSPRFLRRLHALDAHPLVAGARGVGLIGAIELVRDKATRTPFDAASGVAARLADAVLEEGLITRALRDTMALCPPLIITDAQVDEMFDKFERALDTTLSFARDKGLAD